MNDKIYDILLRYYSLDYTLNYALNFESLSPP